MSELEDTLAGQIKRACLPEPTREYRAIPGRRFPFDFAWPEYRVLCEVQGGTYVKGKSGHSSGSGIARDIEKHNLAVLLGWRIIYADTNHIKRTGEALLWIQQALTTPKA